MEVQFVASIAPIIRDVEAAHAFHQGALGLSFEGGGGGDYKYTDQLEGTKHFGLWPLTEAATACFGALTGRRMFRYRRLVSRSRFRTFPLRRTS